MIALPVEHSGDSFQTLHVALRTRDAYYNALDMRLIFPQSNPVEVIVLALKRL